MGYIKQYKEFLKSIIIVMGTNGISYFLIKLFINNYNVINSFVNFPIIKEFVFFYDIWYPFVILVSFFIYIHNKEVYYKLIYTIIISAILSYITFIVYPTVIARPEIEVNNFVDWILDFTYKSDTPPVNCFPSLHCIFCFILIYYTLISKNIKKVPKCIIIIISTLIILSTLFIRQHIIEDGICSIIYVFIAIILVKFLQKFFQKVFKFIF